MKLQRMLIYCAGGLLSLAIIFLFQESDWKAPAEADKLVNPFKNQDWAVKEGQKIYDQICWTCHGDKGKGNGQSGVGLARKPADFTSDRVQSQSDGALFWKITEGRPPMASYKKKYSDDQRWQLVSYIRTFGKNRSAKAG